MDTVSVVQTTGWLMVGATLLRAAAFVAGTSLAHARSQRRSRAEMDRLLDSAEQLSSSRRRSRPTPRPAPSEMIPLRIVQREYETPDKSVCSIYLVRADGSPLMPYRPGQFLTIELPGDDGRPIRRCYSLSETPTRPQRYYRISVKRLDPPAGAAPGTRGGLASTRIVDGLQVGDIISAAPPAGSFVLDRRSNRPVVLVAGGIGITPLLSMLNCLIATRSKREILLVYGVRNRSQHAFQEDIQQLRQIAPNLAVIVFYSQPTPHCRPGIDYDIAGRIDLRILKPLLQARNPEFKLCGPSAMMAAVSAELRSNGVPAADIQTEAFGPSATHMSRNAAAAQQEPLQGNPKASAKGFSITFARSERRITWKPHHGSLLETAEACGVEALSSCRAGQCGTCKVKLKSGKVTYASQPTAEIEAGKCLPCLARPASDIVVDL